MTHMFDTTSIQPGGIANVSRRFVMKGIVGSGALVVGASVLPRPAMAAWDTGAGKMPGGTVNDPHVFVAIDPSGLVTIITNRSEMGTGVRTSLPMVVADEMEADWSRVRVAAGAGRRKEIRQPGHRWVAQRAAFRPADAAMRRGDAHDAGAGGGQAVGRRCIGGAGREPQGRAPRLRQHARLRRTGQGRERVADTAGREP